MVHRNILPVLVEFGEEKHLSPMTTYKLIEGVEFGVERVRSNRECVDI